MSPRSVLSTVLRNMENPSSQPQYFKFNDVPPEAPKPWFLRPEVFRRIGIGGVVLLLVGIAIFASNLMSSMSATSKSALEAARAEVAQRQADCDTRDQACKAQAQTEVARASGVAAACEGLETALMENCVTLIAREKKDSSACASLSDEAKILCVDSVLLARVADGEGMALCENVTNTSKKNSCKAVVTATARSSGDCVKYGVSEELCDAQKIINDLLIAGNFSGCAELAEDERIQCVEMFSSLDADGDGLSAQQEAELGISDANVDTDGDGYSDGEEVAAGYNPLK